MRAKSGSIAVAAATLTAAVLAAPVAAGPNSNISAAMVRNAWPTMEAYRVDHHTYVGATLAKLRAIDPNTSSIEIAYAHTGTYCIQASVLGSWYHLARVGSAPTAVRTGNTRCPSG